MPSVVLDHATHANYTQLWREYLPYGRKYKASEIMNAAEKLYADSPELLAWARFTIIGG